MPAGAPVPGPPALQAAALADVPGLVHGFCGRRGGVSEGVFASLNVSARVGDDAGAVQENWCRVAALAAPGGRFAALRQVHGTQVAVVGDGGLDAGEADALVTTAAGVWLPVLTADCVPVLLAAPRQRVAAAVHAGWRGTAGGILGRTLQVLAAACAVTPDDLIVALGPAIDGCCYEVGAEVAAALEGRPAASITGVERPARVDLRASLIAQALAAGVRPGRIARVGPCTRCAGAEYFSHRGTGGRTGRQVSFVGWATAL